MSKNYLKTKNPKINLIQSILGEIHDDIQFSARDHKYKVKRNVLTKEGVVEKDVSPYSVSSFVANNFGHFNEKNWEISANRSGISKEDLIYNRLLAQVMGCVKGSIIHDYLENFAKGEVTEPNENLAEVIRTETKYNFYPLHKESNNLIRRINRNIEFGKHDDESIKKDIFKTFPDFPKGTLSLELTNIKNINDLVKELVIDLSKKEINHEEFIKELKDKYNFPENTLTELSEHLKDKELNQENIFDAFSILNDNEFLETKEFLYNCSLISISNSFIELNNYIKNNDPNLVNQEDFANKKQDLQSKIRDKVNNLNQMFLLNPEVTAKTIQELKSEEFRLNKDINYAVKEVFENLNAGKMIEKLKEQNLNIIAVEQKMSLGGVIGTSDIVALDEKGQIWILDYKTHKGKLSKDSLGHCGFQLEIYNYMVKTLVREKIQNDLKLQKKVEKVYGCDFNKALDIICKPSNPILLHISSVDKIKENDILQLKSLGLRDILQKINSMEFENNIERSNYFNIEINNLNNKISDLVDNVDSCKLIYTPKVCTQYRENNKIDYQISNLVDDVFNSDIIEVREPKQHIYSTKLDLVVPDTENNRLIINNIMGEFNKEEIIQNLDKTTESKIKQQINKKANDIEMSNC